MMKKRAKWTVGRRPNEMSGLFAASWPASSRSERSWPSWPARISAITGTADCVITIANRKKASRCDGCARVRELEDEVDGLGAANEDDAQIRARTHLANLVAHRTGDQRRFGIIQDDRRL